jgi:hypothetical protein
MFGVNSIDGENRLALWSGPGVFRVPGEAVRIFETVRTGIVVSFRNQGDSIRRMRIT